MNYSYDMYEDESRVLFFLLLLFRPVINFYIMYIIGVAIFDIFKGSVDNGKIYIREKFCEHAIMRYCRIEKFCNTQNSLPKKVNTL